MEILFFIFVSYMVYIFSVSSDDKRAPAVQPKINLKEKKIPLSEIKKKKLLEKYKDFFDNLLSYKLTKEQRLAVIDDSYRNIVIASAGSGKTSILKAKYGYLIESKLAKNNEILVLAFNRAVKDEITNDLNELGYLDPCVETFHSYGNSLLKESNNQTTLSNSASRDAENISATIQIENLLKKCEKDDPLIRKRLREFESLCPFHSIISLADNELEYNKAMQDYPYKRHAFKDRDNLRPLRIPALDGRTFVKSQEEKTIINWLIAMGINVIYEKKFLGVNFDYRPDFFIPENNLYIEHFAINEDDKSPFGQKYIDEYLEKKKIHKQRKTNHLFTYSYEYQNNTLLNKIKKKLEEDNIHPNPISNDLIDRNIQNLYQDNVRKLIVSSIALAKANQLSASQIEKKLGYLEDQFRAKRFSKIIIPFLNAYEKSLQENNEHDFEDMILQSTKMLESNKLNNLKNFKYILVDEFQDLSVSRERFLNSILSFNLGSKLFGVGDDWQSIYRFTGSDIEAVTKFKSKFPLSAKQLPKIEDENEDIHLDIISTNIFSKHVIEKTHRFPDHIAKLSSIFIQKNENQVKKNIVARKPKRIEPIRFFSAEKYSTKYLLKIINNIPKDKNNKKTVYILVRNNHTIRSPTTGKFVIDFKILEKARPDLEFKWNTIHSTKGLEKDYVIILGNDSGSRGFPMWWGEDPLISIFLPDDDKFLYSEERRVMYVAMTRAKNTTYFVHKSLEPSNFITEIIEICKNNNIKFEEHVYRDNVIMPCSECSKNGRSGGMRIRTANPYRGSSERYNVFFSCVLYNPAYKNTEIYCDNLDDALCPKCLENGKKTLLDISNNGPSALIVCTSQNCNFEEDYYNFHVSSDSDREKRIALKKGFHNNKSRRSLGQNQTAENRDIKSKSYYEQKRTKQYTKNKTYLTEDDQDKVGKSIITVDGDKGTIIEFNTAMSGITNQNNLHVKIAFPRQGPKWFLVKHAQLELLNE